MFRTKEKYLSVVILAGLMVGSSFFLAKAALAEEQSGFVYLFKLYYDQGQLFADRDFEFKYDLIAENYTPEIIKGQTGYRGEIMAIGGRKEATFQFSVRQGKMTTKAPYFSDAEAVNFYNPEGRKLLTISVRESSVCDNNGICESDVGEDKNNCSADCHVLFSPSSEPELDPSAIPGPLNPSGFIMAGVPLGIVLLITFLIIWFWRKRKNKHVLPPPQIQ